MARNQQNFGTIMLRQRISLQNFPWYQGSLAFKEPTEHQKSMHTAKHLNCGQTDTVTGFSIMKNKPHLFSVLQSRTLYCFLPKFFTGKERRVRGEYEPPCFVACRLARPRGSADTVYSSVIQLTHQDSICVRQNRQNYLPCRLE